MEPKKARIAHLAGVERITIPWHVSRR